MQLMHAMQLNNSDTCVINIYVSFEVLATGEGLYSVPLGQAGPPTGETDCYLPFSLQLLTSCLKTLYSKQCECLVSPPRALRAEIGRHTRGFTGVHHTRLLMGPDDWVRWSRLCLEEFERRLQWRARFTPWCGCPSRVTYELRCNAWCWCWANVVSGEYLLDSIPCRYVRALQTTTWHLTLTHAFCQTGVLIALLYQPWELFPNVTINE